VSKKGPTIGPKRMTRYEKSRVVGSRALQISMGAPILTRITSEFHDPIRIAKESSSDYNSSEITLWGI
jgi:DNA-directed RNA polymerase subunit K/omega